MARVIEEKHRSRMMLEASMKVFFRELNKKRAIQAGMGAGELYMAMHHNEMDFYGQWG